MNPSKQSSSIFTAELNHLFMQDNPDAVTFVNTVVKEAIGLNASDIFFEPQASRFNVRVRIDGVLYNLGSVSLQVYDAISSRIKILSNLDPTEHRHIQEGQFTFNIENSVIDLRVEIAQTINGEMIVMRILEKKSFIVDLTQIGLSEIGYQLFKSLISHKTGLVLVTGPTGCGKTTTLYSILSELNNEHAYNIMTIEDPIEYQIDGVNQMQVNKEVNFTFSTGLKTMLRLNPDIILVGEIRDQETAEMAIETGLTGHMVLSSLHAGDSVGALMRISDLHIEPYIVNSALIGIIAQRLVRKICQNCKESYLPTQDELNLFMKVVGRAPKQLFKSKGCDQCQQITYKGRTAIFEVLSMTQKMRDAIRDRKSEDELRSIFRQENFISLIADGLTKCEQGITTVDEVIKNSVLYSQL